MAVNWELAGLKTGMVFVSFIVGIGFGMLPIFTKKVSAIKRDRILGVCNAIAAGIFLAAGLLHLLSESSHLFEELYPTVEIVNPAYLLAAFGFFITFLIDKVLFLKEAPHKNDHSAPPKGHRHHDVDAPGHQGFHEGDHEHVKHTISGHGHAHGLTISETGKPSVANYILVLVLSFHSILAGFIIGLEDEVSSALLVFSALISHHWVESFALGVSILRNQVHVKYMARLILFFAVMAPSGIIFGSCLNSVMSNEAGDYLEAYMVGLAAGSFLYVAIVDILVEEFLITRDKWYKTVALVLGFVIEGTMVLLFEYLAHREPHDH